MKDIKITNYKLDSRDTLTCKLTIKAGDYTIAERELLKGADNNGDTLDLDIIGLVNGDAEQYKKKKIQQLVMNMNTYAEKSKTDIEYLKQDLYKKYNVTSRKNMLIEDIEKEVESYRLGIYEFSN